MRATESTLDGDRKVHDGCGLSAQLLDAIAADVSVGGRPAPSSLLRGYLVGKGVPRAGSRLAGQALLLAAVELAFLVAVQRDWPNGSSQSRRNRAHWAIVRRARVPACQLGFVRPVGVDRVDVPASTCAFLSELVPTFVRRLITWAPPVLAPQGKAETAAPVLGNVIPAYLIRQIDPTATVSVQVCDAAKAARLSIVDLTAAIPRLAEIVYPNRDRIVAAAPDARVAMQLTGLERARVFRIRQCSRSSPNDE